MIAAVVVALATTLDPAADPRPELVELRIAGRYGEALATVEAQLARDPERARAVGFDFLRADLFERLGRSREAAEAYAQALTGDSPLAPWARLRLALVQERLGHPEVAAGLATTLLARSPPDALVGRALELLHRTLGDGGDCRLLRDLAGERYSGNHRRLRDLLDLTCAGRQNAPAARSETALREFLSAGTGDALAWEAAGRHVENPAGISDRTTALLLGLTAHSHREFEAALRLLAPWVARGPLGPFDTLGQEAAYAAARSEFWLGRYAAAGERFEAIARSGRTAGARSDAYLQLGRALELGGDPIRAHAAYTHAFHEEPGGRWAGPALFALLRLELLAGDEASARRRLTSLAANASFATMTARGALFLAASDLVRSRTARVGPLLALAERTREASAEEVGYWRGRLAEQTGDLERAIELYLEAAARRPDHPFADAARRRLRSPRLAAAAQRRGTMLAGLAEPASLWRAELLLTNPTEIAAVRARGIALARRSAAHAPWLDGRPVPVRDWPLWRAPPSRAEELLLALGLAEESPASVQRHFPTNRTQLALTGAQLLALGGAHRASLALAEPLFVRRPRDLPLPWVALSWQRLLYPTPWGEIIRSQSDARGVDGALLMAILREESRFDPDAVSPAGARGLAQFVLPTARRLAGQTGLGQITARSLHDPWVAIPLGVAYLAELHLRFRGNVVAMAAAYNAGEDQAALWIRGCFTTEPEELLSKISFAETRAYVTRVLESRQTYRALAAGDR
jgi:soluble lytic murein transglycosylase-like protein/TolA-binding protein